MINASHSSFEDELDVCDSLDDIISFVEEKLSSSSLIEDNSTFLKGESELELDSDSNNTGVDMNKFILPILNEQ